MFLSVLSKLLYKHEIFFEYIFVLSTQFLDYMFKKSINWHVVVASSTFNWKFWGKKTVTISYHLYCLCVQYTVE
jgi:hypothetical protein